MQLESTVLGPTIQLIAILSVVTTHCTRTLRPHRVAGPALVHFMCITQDLPLERMDV